MQYFGGKTRISKDVSAYLNNVIKEKNIKNFLSPFVGGGSVESLIKCENVHCSDKHKYLIELYKGLQSGLILPDNLTKEDYQYIKKNPDENPALTGFVGFGCSFAGKWFGGYAKSNKNQNYCQTSKNSINQKMITLKNAQFSHKSYDKITDISNFIIYCDPPYDGTTQYGKIVGDFDTNEFWSWVRKISKNNQVFVSEYKAPDDFEAVWKKDVKLEIRDSDNKRKDRVEKLFKYKGE